MISAGYSSPIWAFWVSNQHQSTRVTSTSQLRPWRMFMRTSSSPMMLLVLNYSKLWTFLLRETQDINWKKHETILQKELFSQHLFQVQLTQMFFCVQRLRSILVENLDEGWIPARWHCDEQGDDSTIRPFDDGGRVHQRHIARWMWPRTELVINSEWNGAPISGVMDPYLRLVWAHFVQMIRLLISIGYLNHHFFHLLKVEMM